MPSIGLSAYGATCAELVELAVCAEEVGFDALWLGEHVLHPVGHQSEHPSTGSRQHHTGPLVDPTTDLPDPLVVLAAVAAVTETLELGTAVYLAPLRHPLLSARAVATLQELSGGRVRLGVGAGWLAEEFEALDVPFRSRVSRTEECVEIMRRAWVGVPFSHEGAHFRFDEVQVHPRPVSVPVVFGGNGPKALARAAVLGDGWFTSGTPDFAESYRMVREIERLRSEAGRADEFRCYVRVDPADAGDLHRYRENGMDDLVLWADKFWVGETLAERRASLAAAAERLEVGCRVSR
ncbi:TIGR03619 family F420-dependent LLM class oxidoreductase [Rhodococcus sp. O3]|uniref:TIGR03619 family F420-dependent LLM class oxidoreductase n=1 Tax=Rhodococcus sp. O3 TaxID=3404919 RepID=UPI003B66C312